MRLSGLVFLCAILTASPLWASYYIATTQAKRASSTPKQLPDGWSIDKDPLLTRKPKIRLNPLDREDYIPYQSLIYVNAGLSLNYTRFFDLQNTTDPTAGTTLSEPTKPDATKNSLNPSLAIGTSWGFINFPVRTDLEYARYGKVKYSADSVFSLDTYPLSTSVSSTVQTQTMLLNLYYDFLRGKDSSPYASFGAGYYKTTLNLTSGYNFTGRTVTSSAEKNGMAWEAGVGLRHRWNRKYAVDVGYRFTGLGKLKWELAPTNTRQQRLSTERYHDHALKITLNYYPFT